MFSFEDTFSQRLLGLSLYVRGFTKKHLGSDKLNKRFLPQVRFSMIARSTCCVFRKAWLTLVLDGFTGCVGGWQSRVRLGNVEPLQNPVCRLLKIKDIFMQGPINYSIFLFGYLMGVSGYLLGVLGHLMGILGYLMAFSDI